MNNTLYFALSDMVNQMVSRSNLPKYGIACYEAIKRLSCVTTFAVCPTEQEVSSSYLPPCRLQCEQVEAICGIENGGFLHIPENVGKYHICNELPEMNCALNLPKGYFAISPKQKDYAYIATMYIVLCTLWTGIAIYWNYAVYFKYLENCPLVCRLISIVPVIKCVVMAIGVGFWQTCTDWKMCSFWLQVALVNIHLIYETAIMVSLLLLGLGWTITRQELEGHEWRGVVCMMTSFYIGNSIILVLQTTDRNYSNIITANAILYSIAYLYIAFSALVQLRRVSSHVKMLRSSMAPEFTAPLKFKREMFIVFMMMTFLSIIAEATTQIIVASFEGFGPFIAIYEIGNFIAISIIGYYFRPRPYSPFFLMEPRIFPNRVAGVGDRDDDRLLTVVKAIKSDMVSSEVELNPLVPVTHPMRHNHCETMQQRILSTGSRLMVLQNINDDISIGVCSSVGERIALKDIESGKGSGNQRLQKKKASDRNRDGNNVNNETAANNDSGQLPRGASSSDARGASVEMTTTGVVMI